MPAENADFLGCRPVRARWLKSGGDDDAAELGGHVGRRRLGLGGVPGCAGAAHSWRDAAAASPLIKGSHLAEPALPPYWHAPTAAECPGRPVVSWPGAPQTTRPPIGSQMAQDGCSASNSTALYSASQGSGQLVLLRVGANRAPCLALIFWHQRPPHSWVWLSVSR